MEVRKFEKHEILKDEIARMRDMKKLIVIPVVVGTLDTISTGFEEYVAAIRLR